MKTEDFDLLPDSVVNYLRTYLQNTKGSSELTILEYASDLRTFFRFIVARKSGISPTELPEDFDLSYIDYDFIKDITTNDIFYFLDYCNSVRDNKKNTRSRKISALNGYFKYISTKMHYIDSNPMEPIELPKVSKTLPKYLTLEQSVALLKSVDGEYKVRDYCILTLFLNCGLRVAELVSLNISDINFEDRTMKITGKGDKQRISYLNNSCIEALYAYLQARPHENVKDRNALFLSHLNKRLSRRGAQDIVYRYLDKIGLGNAGYSVHKLRHTAATLMYQHSNIDILTIKEVLGHEHLSTTEIYTHLLNEQVKAAIDSNPLNKNNISIKK